MCPKTIIFQDCEFFNNGSQILCNVGKSELLYPFWTTAHFQHFFCTVSPQRASLISQRIFPAGCDIFADMMSPSKISWLTTGNMKHVDVMLKINWVLIFNFGNLLGPFEWQLRSNLWMYWNKLPKGITVLREFIILIEMSYKHEMTSQLHMADSLSFVLGFTGGRD